MPEKAGGRISNENPPRELPAVSNDCDLILIDRTIPAVVYKKRFAAQMDDKTGVTANTNSIERTAWYEINDFFKTVPRR